MILFEMDGWMLFQLIAYVTNQTIAVLAVSSVKIDRDYLVSLGLDKIIEIWIICVISFVRSICSMCCFYFIHSIGFVPRPSNFNSIASIANFNWVGNEYNLIHIGSVIQYCTGKITNNKYQITRPLKIKKMRPTLPQALF